MKEMQSLMASLRNNPLRAIQGKKVVRLDDYLERKTFDCGERQSKEISLPSSDVLSYWLEDQSKLVIRPSGTEPKMKIYSETCDPPAFQVADSIVQCDLRLASLVKEFKKLILF
jgi:phosphoglucomutase